jgi:hypothetical protein
MPIVNELVPNHPNILISKIVHPLDITKDPVASLKQIDELLAKTPGKLYIISDCTNVDPNFSDVVTGLAETSRPNSPLRNPRTETYVVAVGAIFANMVEWYKQQQYGSVQMRLYKTVDEAVAAVKADIAKAR